MASLPGKQTIGIHILPNTQEVKAIRQLNLVSDQNITLETFYLRNYTQNVLEKLFSDAFLKNQN